MCEISTKVICPHCPSTKIVKNGHKKDGTQNFLCKDCGKQFQFVYKYTGANPSTKHQMVSMLLWNCGIRDIQAILKVSRGCILHTLISEAQKCVIVPTLKHYKTVQIDEFWSYVGHKKKGKRGIKTVKKLYQLLKNLVIDEYCTDNRESFVHVFQKKITE